MKYYYLVCVSTVLVFFASNTSAGNDAVKQQSVCKIKKNLHQNIADVLTNDTGIDVLVEFVEIISEICMDPQAHNSIILLFDVVTDNLENPVVAKSLGNVFFWIRKVMKNPDFQLALHESMRGVNKLFDRIDVLQPMLDTMFRNIQKLFDDPNFDSTFELVVENITTLINMKKNVLYKTSSMLMKPFGVLGARASFKQPQSKITRSASNKY